MQAQPMTAAQVIEIAKEHAHLAPMRSSAESCIRDAETWLREGVELTAYAWAVRSLKYSLGIGHPLYQQLA